jgi:hypothetical protein
MVDLSKEQEDVIMAVYDRLPAAPVAGMPAELTTLINAKNAIAAAETAWQDINVLPPLDFTKQLEWQNQLQAADDAIIAAQDAYLSTAKSMLESGTLQPAIGAYDQMLADAAAAEQARLAAEAQAAEEAKYAPQPVVADTRKIFNYREDAEATLLYNIRETLPAQSDNEFIKPLIAANTQGDESYEAAVTALLDAHYESGALETGLKAYQDEVKQLGLLPMPMDRQQQQMALIGNYQQRLGEIPLTAAVPPALNNIVSLAREIETMRNAPSGTYTDAQQETAFYNYVQEGFKLYDQRVDPGTFLRDKYPSNGENIDTYFASLPEVAWNNPGLLAHSAKDFVINLGTTLTAGLFVDVPDTIGQLTNIGSFRNALGLDKDVPLMSTWSAAVKDTIEDNITGKPTIRAGTNDQLVYNGNQNVLDVASLFVGGGIVKGGVNYGTQAVKFLGESNMGLDTLIRAFTRVTVKSADDVAPLADNLAANAARETAEATVRAADNAAAKSVEDLSSTMVRRRTWAGSEYVARTHDGLTARAAYAAEHGNTVKALAYESMAFSMRATRAVTSGAVTLGATYLITDYATGEALSRGLAEGTRALADSIREYSPEMADMLVNKVAPAVAGLGVGILQQSYKSTKAYLGELTGLGADDPMVSMMADTYTSGPVAAALHSQGYEIDPVRLAEIYRESENQENPGAFVAQKLQEEYNVPPEIMAGLQGYVPENAPGVIQAAVPAVTDKFRAATERYTSMLDWQKKIEDLATGMQNMTGLGWLAPVVAFAAAIIGMIAGFFKPEAAQNVDVQTADGGKKITDVARALGQGDVTLPNVTNHEGKPQNAIVIDGTTYVRVEPHPVFTPGMVPQ